MTFRILSCMVAAALIIKAAVALATPQRFYTVRRRQYESKKLPNRLLIPPVVVFTLTLVAWHTVIYHYQPWGWIVTVFLTLVSCMAVHHLLAWTRHRQAMLRLIGSPRVKWVDRLLLVVGLGFLVLALSVYEPE